MCRIPEGEGCRKTDQVNGGSGRKALLSLSWKGKRNSNDTEELCTGKGLSRLQEFTSDVFCIGSRFEVIGKVRWKLCVDGESKSWLS